MKTATKHKRKNKHRHATRSYGVKTVLEVLLARVTLRRHSVCVVILTVFALLQLHMMNHGSCKYFRRECGNSYVESDNDILHINTTVHDQKMNSDAVISHSLRNTVNKVNITNIVNTTLHVKSRIGILIPSCTRNITNKSLDKLSLTSMCLPSIYKTTEDDLLYTIYIGIDKGDYLESFQNELKTRFQNVTIVVSTGNTFTYAVNAMARQAYQDGMDYLVRINDDTTFETQGWASLGMAILKHYRPPNIGVVGPTCKQGNTRILTHDMVHRTHFDIFGFYYPNYFDNRYADEWMTEVYKPGRSTKLSNWTVVHHLGKHGRRYTADRKKYALLKQIVSFDNRRLAKYLQ